MKLVFLLLVSLLLASAIVIPFDARLTRRTLGSHDSGPPAPATSVSKLPANISVRPKKIIPVLENYKVIRKLGAGAFSDVYLAQDRRKSSSHVALKTCPISQLPTAAKEVEILERISPHRNIIQLIETTKNDIHFVMVLEYIPGGDLTYVFDLQQILVANDFHLLKLMFKQILEAVLHIHNKGIVHRDLKLENILVCFDPKNPPTNDDAVLVKLTDFGLSHDVDVSPIPLFGSLPYMAPEVITNNLSDVDPRKIDVWALGVILFRLIEGRFPFDAATTKDLFLKIVNGVYSFEPSVPEPAKALVSKMLTGDWKERAGIQEIMEDAWLKN